MAERAAKQLELNKSELPNSITEVIATLSRAGFDAYIVGGGVRDTLLGLKPKDFDAVTDAKPHEIKDVFGKRCRIIGRRFQLAHVYSGRELIEVATFRGPSNSDANTNQDGMIIRDNVWGDIKQDFVRRDFSINALYYQPLKGVVHDYCGALDDIDNKIIRLLGKASVRIEEDPVRLLRALRFKAKLGFEFDDELAEQFHDDNWARLDQISPHRLYDETQKMFTGGYLAPLLPLLFESGAIDSLIIYPPSEPSALVQQVAINTDKRIGAGKSINPAFFYAALLWENYLHQLEKAKKRNLPFAEAQMQAASKVIDRQRIKTAIPKFAEQFIRDIWILQPKLAAPRSKQILQLAEHPRFRAGFDFLLLREQCGDAEHPLSESTNGMGDWWQTYQTLSEKQQQQAINEFDENIRRGSYKRGRGRNRSKHIEVANEQIKQLDNDAQVPSSSSEEQTIVNDASNIPSRRRRRAADNSSPIESQSKQAVGSKAHPSKGSNKALTEQAQQNNSELAQLQQLSLASCDASDDPTANKSRATQPAPLFVIEHKNVVPPLQKQIASDNMKQTEPKKAKPAPNKEQTPPKKTRVSADSKSKDLQAHDKAPKTKQANAKQESATTVTATRSAAKATPGKSVATVAKSPQLVSTNNEPIPHQRRRRQPSSEPQVAEVNSTASADYAKKAPKAADQPKAKTETKRKVNKVADVKEATVKETDVKVEAEVKKVAKASNPSNNKLATNQGPVPSKRRRRQPSSDKIATDN
ncbi:polynucleotide adenylyltransferase PcnB [Psychrobacter sp. CAL346-MNA-CIBAN-0220]|uniref:polynucleotide adenylyltransferase PcnB n=1 Tax=Psychrobacter sp. CAL346-MNA-CIBAN-0220 TaxID=3140457 RepID=UPI00332C3DF4